jgi:hypothetical protein
MATLPEKLTLMAQDCPALRLAGQLFVSLKPWCPANGGLVVILLILLADTADTERRRSRVSQHHRLRLAKCRTVKAYEAWHKLHLRAGPA